ncbi:uncharacterized protein LOC114364927 [Ostrinia furnacalis]|uniref:uncharacterized protein LOC114364927 n=1 Tax=Ostrinia furnacalis TaxID=93504 RepID=UPI001038FFD7|nr:uncharacterized protein LOC114364927 [Ostrinia furnacalis]
MGKRKRSRSRDSDYDSILRKIKKLESKLRKRRRLSSSASVEGESDSSYYKRYDTQEYENHSLLQAENYADDNADIYGDYQPESTEPLAGPSTSIPAPTTEPESVTHTVPASTQADPSSVNANDAPATSILDENTPSLDPEILQLLGEDPTCQKNHGENLHKDIAPRWAHILANGLSKEIQLDLIKCYLPPENCPNMRAPKLNLEIKAALLETNIKKDLYSQSKQNQLASSLSAIGRVLNWALASNSTVPQDIIKALSDAGRLICDSHYKESQSRRYAALSTLNKDIRDTVKNTTIDEHLFGSALSDHIKSSKAISKTGSEIKQKIQRPTYRAPTTTTQPRGALNSRGAPPRVAAAVEPRTTPAPRRPPRDRRLEAPRGRRSTNHARQQTRRR